MIHQCSIHGFRGSPGRNLELSETTCIIGTNGSGKTHLLEAIHLISGGELQYLQAPWKENSNLEITYHTPIGPKVFSRTRQDGKDIYRIQGKAISGTKYRESLPYRTLFVSPFDMNLLYFAPSARREYIDSILLRAFPTFSKVRREFTEAMRQRNSLLKHIREGQVEKKELNFWDQCFTEKAFLYHQYRKKWYTFIQENSEHIHTFLPEYQIQFLYESKIDVECPDEPSIRAYLVEKRERDILTGHTHIGPHLDDFSFSVAHDGDTIESALFLSRGENKTLLLGLKYLELLFLERISGLPVILLFDDIFAELDEAHAKSIIGHFDAQQVIITSQRPLPKNENWAHFSCININPEYHSA